MKSAILAICLLLTAILRRAESAQCACATTKVHIRNGVGTSHDILTTLSAGDCLPYKGDQRSGWANVDYHGHDGWVSHNYVNIGSCNGSSVKTSGGCPHIVSRANWGARAPKSVTNIDNTIVRYAFIHHGESGSCSTQSGCAAIVRSYQNYHMDTHGKISWSDIGYSFVVGEDGKVYEGRGWDRVGAHTLGYNFVGLDFCMIGNFMNRVPRRAALNTLKSLIACEVSMGKINSNYILRGHSDMGRTGCPGKALYNLIRHY